jgi:hypothetical protein
MSVNGDDAAAAAAAAVAQPSSVHLPDFWLNETDMWFQKAEASFRRARVTDSHVKYDYVLMKLPEQVLTSVKDVIRAVTDATEDPYMEIKKRLVSSYTQSKWQLANKLLDYPDIGDMRPSMLMDNMLSLLPPGDQPGTLFQAMFLRRLPAVIRDQLGAIEFNTPRAMAEHADLLWDARGGSAGQVAAVSSQNDRGRRRSPFRSPGRGGRSPNRGGRQRQQTPGPDGLCFYHHRFGDRAFKCTPPCAWQENQPAAGSNN